MSWTIRGSSGETAEQVRELCGSDVKKCYQCGKCTAGCPVAPFADFGPRTVMHLVRLGERDRVLRSTMIWLCAGCEACSTRCPRDVGPSHVIDALRHVSMAEGYHEEANPTVETIPAFHQVFLDSIRHGGRLWELFMVGMYKLRTLDLFSDTLLGARLFFNRKLSLLPPRRIGSGARIMKKIAEIRAAQAEAMDRAMEEARRAGESSSGVPSQPGNPKNGGDDGNGGESDPGTGRRPGASASPSTDGAHAGASRDDTCAGTNDSGKGLTESGGKSPAAGLKENGPTDDTGASIETRKETAR